MNNENKMITSTTNPAIKRIKSFGIKKYRDEEKLFLVEGLPLVCDALDHAWQLDTLLFSGVAPKILADCQKKKIPVLEVTDKILSLLTRRDNAQPVLGIFKQRFHDIGAIERKKEGLWLGLEDVRDPGNLGTIIRTADAVGAAGILLIGNTCDPWSPEVIRATIGSFAHVPLIPVTQDNFIQWRKNFKGRVVGTHLHQKAVDYRDIPRTFPLLLLMGSEQSGLSEKICSACDTLVKIPMAGKTESLNLAVSTGVLLYEVFRDKIK